MCRLGELLKLKSVRIQTLKRSSQGGQKQAQTYVTFRIDQSQSNNFDMNMFRVGDLKNLLKLKTVRIQTLKRSSQGGQKQAQTKLLELTKQPTKCLQSQSYNFGMNMVRVGDLKNLLKLKKVRIQTLKRSSQVEQKWAYRKFQPEEYFYSIEPVPIQRSFNGLTKSIIMFPIIIPT